MASQLTVTIRPGSPLLSDSLYQLESIFGESSGHGAGVGGEDIHFPFPRDKRCELSINRDHSKLTISVGKLANDTWIDLDLANIPDPMRERLVGVLREHTKGPLPDELTGRDGDESR
jgi:hypothetical protein